MTIKKVEIRPPGNSYLDILYPKTSADMVVITDVGNIITATDTEGALQEIVTNVNTKMPKSGGTFTSVVTLNADPVNPLEASTKQYVDNSIVASSGVSEVLYWMGV